MNVVDEIVMLPVSAIKPYHRNVRHNRETIERLCKLVPVVGFNVPLVLDRNNVIVKGHTRWAVAIRLGMEKVPCVYSDADEETLKLDRLADNKVQEYSKWDMEALISEVTSINLDFDLSVIDLDIAIADAEIPDWDTAPVDAPQVAENATISQSVGEPVLQTAVPYTAPQMAQDCVKNEEPFITPEDIKRTLPNMMNQYAEVMCDKCGNRMFIKR